MSTENPEIGPKIEEILGSVDEQVDMVRHICRSSAYPEVTQAAIAAEMGADEAQVSRWINRRAGMSLESRVRLHDALYRLLGYHKEDV